MNSNFDSCMKTWVKMVNENRYTTNPDDYTTDDSFEPDKFEEKIQNESNKFDEIQKEIDSYYKKAEQTGEIEGNLKESDDKGNLSSDSNSGEQEQAKQPESDETGDNDGEGSDGESVKNEATSQDQIIAGWSKRVKSVVVDSLSDNGASCKVSFKSGKTEEYTVIILHEDQVAIPDKKFNEIMESENPEKQLSDIFQNKFGKEVGNLEITSMYDGGALCNVSFDDGNSKEYEIVALLEKQIAISPETLEEVLAEIKKNKIKNADKKDAIILSIWKKLDPGNEHEWYYQKTDLRDKWSGAKVIGDIDIDGGGIFANDEALGGEDYQEYLDQRGQNDEREDDWNFGTDPTAPDSKDPPNEFLHRVYDPKEIYGQEDENW